MSDPAAHDAPRRAMGDSEHAVNVPLLGRIAAGTPIEALQNKDRRCAGARRHDRRAAIITRWK